MRAVIFIVSYFFISLLAIHWGFNFWNENTAPKIINAGFWLFVVLDVMEIFFK